MMNDDYFWELPRYEDKHKHLASRRLRIRVLINTSVEGEEVLLRVSEEWDSSVRWTATVPVTVIHRLAEFVPEAMQETLRATVRDFVEQELERSLHDAIRRVLK